MPAADHAQLRLCTAAQEVVGGKRQAHLVRYRGDVDRDEGIIRVRHGEDALEGRIDPKSAAGVRRVPVSRQLESILDEYDAYIESRLGRSMHKDERYFPGDPIGEKFCPNALVERADKCWAQADLEPVRLHDARHTFASYLIAAGVNAKAIQTYMGHSSIQVTYDIYGHLFPGNEAEAAALLDDYLVGGSPNRSPSHVQAT